MTGKCYRDYFDLLLINKLQQLINHELTQKFIPSGQPAAVWENGNLYVQTAEVFGILPIPAIIQTSAGMNPFDLSNKPKLPSFLAEKQGTRYAVLTLHTEDEKTQFSDFMRTESVFSSSCGSNWPTAAHVWNQATNGKTIFYKVCCQL